MEEMTIEESRRLQGCEECYLTNTIFGNERTCKVATMMPIKIAPKVGSRDGRLGIG
jgi:hypothetical protein